MRIVLAGLAAAGIGLLCAGAASAQATGTDGWSGRATLYGWLPGISGSQKGPDGQPLIDLDSAGVLDALDMAFMGAAEVRYGKFALLLDAVYADLSQDGTWVQGRLDTETKTRLGFYTAALAYRVYEQDRAYVDLYGGARYFDTRVTFEAATARRSRSWDASMTWTDPIVGIRGAFPVSERWSLAGFADYGGFDSGSDESWEVYGGANYDFTDRWQGTIGYRYVSIVKEIDSRLGLDIDIHGPLVGISYKF